MLMELAHRGHISDLKSRKIPGLLARKGLNLKDSGCSKNGDRKKSNNEYDPSLASIRPGSKSLNNTNKTSSLYVPTPISKTVTSSSTTNNNDALFPSKTWEVRKRNYRIPKLPPSDKQLKSEVVGANGATKTSDKNAPNGTFSGQDSFPPKKPASAIPKNRISSGRIPAREPYLSKKRDGLPRHGNLPTSSKSSSKNVVSSKHITLQVSNSSTDKLTTSNNSAPSKTPTLSRPSLHSKRDHVIPKPKVSNPPSSISTVNSSFGPKSFVSRLAEQLRPPPTPVSSIPSAPARPTGIFAQLGVFSKPLPPPLPRVLPKKKCATLRSTKSIHKQISSINGKTVARSAKHPVVKTEPPVKRPRIDPPPATTRTIMEKPQVPELPARGIAAQYASLRLAGLARPAKLVDEVESDDDTYASDDSFIDDTDCTNPKEYIKAVKTIHQALGFDPAKYAKVSKYDDLSTMESSYRQIEKEEKISMRLAAQEDEADMAWEAERKRRRATKG